MSEVEVALDGRLVLAEEFLLFLPFGRRLRFPRRLVVHRSLHVGDLAEVDQRVIEQVGRVIHEEVDKADVTLKVDSEEERTPSHVSC